MMIMSMTATMKMLITITLVKIKMAMVTYISSQKIEKDISSLKKSKRKNENHLKKQKDEQNRYRKLY